MPARTPSWPPMWASTRCGPSSTSTSTIPASCSPPAASAPWASAWGPPSAPSVGNPDKTVVHITGDGCFRMNCHELATEELLRPAGHHRDLQQPDSGHGAPVAEPDLPPAAISQTDSGPRPRLRQAGRGLRPEGPPGHPAQAELEAGLHARRWQARGRGYVIDCAIDMDEMVHPMVAGGAPHHRLPAETKEGEDRRSWKRH